MWFIHLWYYREWQRVSSLIVKGYEEEGCSSQLFFLVNFTYDDLCIVFISINHEAL